MSETQSFSIIELLQYVRKKEESGCLRFTKDEDLDAELYFKKGHLIHARNMDSVGDDVVYHLLGCKSVSIKMDRKLSSEQETITRSAELLMLGALGVLSEEESRIERQALGEEEDNIQEPSVFFNGQSQVGLASYEKANLIGLTSKETQEEIAPAISAPAISAPAFSFSDEGTDMSDPEVEEEHLFLLDDAKTIPARTLTKLYSSFTPLSNNLIQSDIKVNKDIVALNESEESENETGTPELNEPQFGSNDLAKTAEAEIVKSGSLESLLGDEILRPPRFLRWPDLHLPFVSAYSMDNYPGEKNLNVVLELLCQEGFSGFLSCVTTTVEAVTIIYRGRPFHTRFAEERAAFQDQRALRQLTMLEVGPDERNAVLIYPLEADFVHSYFALLNGEVLLDKFSSQGMKINKLLNTLEHSQHTGVVRVSNSGGENGFIFLSNGRKLGSYYEVRDVLEESILRVYQIVGKPGSLIDVLTSPPSEKMFETTNHRKTAADIKQDIMEAAQEIFGKRAGRIVNLIGQAEENSLSLRGCCNQARLVAQMLIDRVLADQFYDQAKVLLQELD